MPLFTKLSKKDRKDIKDRKDRKDPFLIIHNEYQCIMILLWNGV